VTVPGDLTHDVDGCLSGFRHTIGAVRLAGHVEGVGDGVADGHMLGAEDRDLVGQTGGVLDHFLKEAARPLGDRDVMVEGGLEIAELQDNAGEPLLLPPGGCGGNGMLEPEEGGTDPSTLATDLGQRVGRGLALGGIAHTRSVVAKPLRNKGPSPRTWGRWMVARPLVRREGDAMSQVQVHLEKPDAEAEEDFELHAGEIVSEDLIDELEDEELAKEEALEAELEDVLGSRLPSAADLDGHALPVLERSLKETLRRYPAAWVGPRRTTREVTLGGVRVPAEIGVHYSSWATHHLPELWPEPFAFDPDRFLPEREAALPRGAYIPFGGGSRMCLGKRFGEYELRALAAVLLTRVRFEPCSQAEPRIVTTPTLGPKGGLRFLVRAR